MQAPQTAETSRRFAGILWQSLRLVTFFTGLRAPPRRVTPGLIVLLAMLDIGAVVAGGYLAAPDGSVFEASGLPACLAAQGLILMVAAVLGPWLEGGGGALDRLAIAFGAVLWIDLIWLLLQFWPAALDRLDEVWPTPLPLAGVLGSWLALALCFAWSRQTSDFRRGFVVALVLLIAVGAPASMLDRGAPVWLAPAGESDAEADGGAQALHVDENLLYGEADLLQQAIDGLAPRTPGRINLYFIGFAGNGEQLVFTREVTFVKALFEERFSAAGHAIALMNNASTPGQVPLATATSLRAALMAIGERMSDSDIVVLFMTSHGSRETGVNVAMPPFEFEDIDPKALAEMFDAAHIRQRVVIISACYAGIFVAPLANPNTLVITAADATHTSFGCSNEADFTYFGRAYFHDALISTDSLSDAFNKALPLIADRETQQGFEHSNPQMALGSALARTLERFASQKPAAARPAPRAEHVSLMFHYSNRRADYAAPARA